MTVVESSIDIKAPIRPVFEAVTDPRRAPDWNPHIIHVHDVTLPIDVGATWRQLAMVWGRNLNLTCRVTKYQPPSFGEIEVTGDQEGYVWTRCEEVGEATRLTHGIDFETPRGAFRTITGRFLEGMVRRELSDTLNRQRDVLEQENGGIGGSRT